MIVLDTDAISVLEHDSDNSLRLRALLRQAGDHDVRVSIVSFEEQVRGWLAMITAAKTVNQTAYIYERLHRVVARYGDASVLGFDTEAVVLWSMLRKQYRRLGAMDLKIAAIAMNADAILVTANLKDFDQIEGLRIMSWK